ncbi:MAG TPA: SLBB domain-containing protein [Clostridia bacterium]|nr:SLBB domain-containing protein [Clostridia bacterium]
MNSLPSQKISSPRRSLAIGVLLFIVAVLALAPLHAQDESSAPSGRPKTGKSTASSPSYGNRYELPASRIIAMLQQDPELLSQVKIEIARVLREQGRVVQESDVPDSLLLRRIEQDAELRSRITEELLKRGYIEPDDPELKRPAGSDESETPYTDKNERRPGNWPDDFEEDGEEDLTLDGKESSRAQNAGRPRVTVPEFPRVAKERDNEQVLLRHRRPPHRSLQSLEDLYTQTLDPTVKLERFGANMFRKGMAPDPKQMDLPAGPDYVLGPGDGLTVELWGSLTRKLSLTVDREGRIALPEVGTVQIGGKTLDQAREFVGKVLRTQLQDVGVDVSLGRLRTVRIYVVGDVVRAGAYNISSLSTPLNALYAAGGPTARGSLRTVKHYRGKELIREVDIYNLLLNGVSDEVGRLEAGDTILVPPMGPQVSVAGMVRRPALYELKGETELYEALELAGGVLVAGSLRQIAVERVQAHERRVMLSLDLPEGTDIASLKQALVSFKLQDGDRVTISSIPAYSNETVYLDGHVTRPGKYPFRKDIQVSDLIRSYKDLLPEPSTQAEIIRLQPPDFRPMVLQFSLSEVMQHKATVMLQPFDTVRVFGRYEVDAPKVAIFGEVLRPGEYPLTDGMSTAELVRMAGGFRRSAYRQTADLASYEIEGGERVQRDHRVVEISKALDGVADMDIRLKPGDVLTVRQLAGWEDIGGAVTVSGEVQHPGTYGIQESERLSSLLRRAGGFRESAYPAGAVLQRTQVRQMDRQARQALIRRIEGAKPKGAGAEQAVMTTAFMQQQQQILTRLKEEAPAGRQVIRISADLGKWENTPADVEIRAGDVLIIPKRPDFVLVNGQVNSPSAITYVPGKNAQWYLRKAGGATEFGNKKAIFVVRADGSVIGAGNGGWWSGGVMGTVLQPGDSLVVPERIATENTFWRNLLNAAQVTSSVAIAARVATTF